MPELRKPIESLTLIDLDTFPIWQYADDEEGFEGRDETWVRPIDASVVPNRSYSMVAADFRTSCGRNFRGCISVSRFENPPDIFQGVVYFEDTGYLIPNPDLVFFDQAMVDLLKGLDLSMTEIFPITYTLRVPFDDEWDRRSGILDGQKAKPDLPARPNAGSMA